MMVAESLWGERSKTLCGANSNSTSLLIIFLYRHFYSFLPLPWLLKMWEPFGYRAAHPLWSPAVEDDELLLSHRGLEVDERERSRRRSRRAGCSCKAVCNCNDPLWAINNLMRGRMERRIRCGLFTKTSDRKRWSLIEKTIEPWCV